MDEGRLVCGYLAVLPHARIELPLALRPVELCVCNGKTRGAVRKSLVEPKGVRRLTNPAGFLVEKPSRNRDFD